MKKPFQVGDRVRAYYINAVAVGIVTAVNPKGSVRIKCDNGGWADVDAHIKQCRRLVKKERKVYVCNIQRIKWGIEEYQINLTFHGFQNYNELRRGLEGKTVELVVRRAKK